MITCIYLTSTWFKCLDMYCNSLIVHITTNIYLPNGPCCYKLSTHLSHDSYYNHIHLAHYHKHTPPYGSYYHKHTSLTWPVLPQKHLSYALYYQKYISHIPTNTYLPNITTNIPHILPQTHISNKAHILP